MYSDKTSIYDISATDILHVTIGKQRNPFPAEASTRTSLEEITMLPRPLSSPESLLYDQMLCFYRAAWNADTV